MSGSDIVLATQNATWTHPSFGLRCLRANLGPWREHCRIVELDPRASPAAAAHTILDGAPRIVGLGVYIWNVMGLTEVARRLKEERPNLVLVLGGPEISHEWDDQPIARWADYIVRNEGELVFADLCARLLQGERPADRVLDGGRPPLERLALPYDEYTDADLTSRFTYVETTRGCPYGCAFCLSSLDRAVREWPLDAVLAALDRLLSRGARRLKFVDRTFNLNPKRASTVLRFLLERIRPGCSVHFEWVPTGPLPAIGQWLAKFPPETLRLEVGIQTFDEDVNARVGRCQRAPAVEDTLRFLHEQTHARVHADLLVGLPGQTLNTVAHDFDRLLALGPAEIQVGLLKRLRGTTLARHAAEWELKFDVAPPYPIIETPDFSVRDLARVARLARYWERLGNQSQFPRSLRRLWRDESSAFAALLRLSDDLYARFEATHAIPLEKIAEAIFEHLVSRGITREEAAEWVWTDYARDGRRRHPPRALRRWLTRSGGSSLFPFSSSPRE